MPDPEPFMTKYSSLLLLVMICSAVSVQGQLKADFKASPLDGCAPLYVEFQDLSTGNPMRWVWDLGNNTTTQVKNPTTSYFVTGFYTIKLKVFNSAGDSSETVKTQYIKVTTPPIVDFSTNVLEGCMPLTVKFSDLSTAESGTITKLEWDFGDGEIGEGKNPVHIYKSSGVYNVTLKVTNNNSCVNFTSKKSLIKVYARSVADFTSNLTDACSAPASISFENLTVDDGESIYKWDFGDSQTSTEKSPIHVYQSLGKFDVRLIVTNQYGCADTLKKLKFINVGRIKASFSAPASSCINAPVFFENTTLPPPQSIFWDFGDGTFSSAQMPTKTFLDSGIYLVKMVVRTESCADSVIQKIEIKKGLNLDFSASPLSACKPPLTVNFTNLSSGPNIYTWRFGDGTTANAKNVSHTYTNYGNYTVTLFGNNNSGCADSLKKSIIQIGRPLVTLNVPIGGCAPFTHKFTASFTPAFQIQNYKWNFGDGSTSNGATPSHTFTNPGNYTVSLVYTTSDGCTDSLIVQNAVKVGTPPTVNFKANPLNTCAYVPVFFTDLSKNIGDSVEYDWTFGDGGKSVLKNPEYIYQDTGKFDVKLVVINNGCADSIVFKNYVHIDPPVAAFNFKQICGISGNIQFTNNSIGADTWIWDFGDGNTSKDKDPLHVYSLKGDYNVSLSVTNNKTGCSFTKKSNIAVIDETPNFIADAKESCKNIPVKFSVTGVNTKNIQKYTWKFGDGSTTITADTVTSYTYTASGVFDVSLTIEDNNFCTTTVTKNVFLKIVGPTPAFRAPNPVVCKDEVVTFIDSSYTFGSGNIVSWEWNYGDDSPPEKMTAGPFTHKYINSGFYSVSLKVTDNKGCIDNITKINEVRVPFIKANFSSDSLSCTYQLANFKNLSEGEGLTYLWNFGDNSTSIGSNVKHNYADEGIYTVNLLVKDLNGCTNDTTQINAVTIANPLAKFKLNTGFSTCPPLIVQFNNLSEKYRTYEWDFGDASKSVLLNPSHFYGSVGNFKALLTVRGGRGCVDTVSTFIEVKGPTGSFSYDILEGCVPLKVNFQAKTKFSDSLRWDFNDGNSSSQAFGIVTHTYDAPGFYEPKLILRDDEGCVVPLKGLDTIKVYGVKAAFTFDSNQICDSQTLQFYNKSVSNDKIAKYKWAFGDNSFSDVENPGKMYSNPGIYKTTLFITTKKGCTDSIQSILPITVKKTPEIAIRGNSQACIFSDIAFSGLVLKSDASAISWKWDFGNGKFATQQNPPVQTYGSAGVYTVRTIANSANGCSDTVSHVINLFPLPVINISGEKVICLDNSTTLLATGASQYSWSPAASLSCVDCASTIAKPAYSTQYKVTGVSDQGCMSGDSIMVEVKRPFKITVSEKDTLCVGQTVQIFAKGADKYIWSPTSAINNGTLPNPIVSPTITTTYRVVGLDSKNCFSDTGYVPVQVYEYPKVIAGENKTINVGSTITITPIVSPDATSIIWTPSVGILNSDKNGVVTLMPKQTTTYNIEVKNAGGCLALDKVTVFVICNNANIFIPNTFSPNGDGVNEIFYPHGTGVFRIKNLRIFNRWGQVVFDRSNFMANDASAGWDGTLKGQKLNSDVFVYSLIAVCENNEELIFKGDITLVR